MHPSPDDHKQKRARLLSRTAELANNFLDEVAARPVAQSVDFAQLVAEVSGDGIGDEGQDPTRVIEDLARLSAAGIVGSAGPRYFGWVVGGSLPAALAADWLASAWDQNGAFYSHSPLAAAVERAAAKWLVDLFRLTPGTRVGFVTGGTMGNFTGLAAGRHALYEKLGWDVEKRGLIGAPPITVVISDESHVSALAGLQMLGLGSERIVRVPADEQGRMRADQLR